MNVWRLKSILEDLDEDMEVRLAMQPAWAMEYSIGEAVQVEIDGEEVLYLSENNQLGYLPGAVSEELGW